MSVLIPSLIFRPSPGPIIVQPAPVPPPLIPYPSGVSQTFFQPVQYPPQSYPSSTRILQYPSHQQSHLGPQAEQTAFLPPRSGSRANQRRYSNEQAYHQDRIREQPRRFSLDERLPDEYYSPKAHPRRALTPEPTSSNYRPRNHRSASTSQRVPGHQQHTLSQDQTVFDEDSGSSEEYRRFNRPVQRRSASTSARHSTHLSVREGRIRNPPRRSFDQTSRDHLQVENSLHAHSHQY
ncbi:uncharacterized protein I206_105980 [Kwoniella pini CBS 10737]|uniref:Uncharacterized protein n=1 Tax=Kwoniella pini CBS 10737 TaxID=1296096 RepID=A0A1B9I0P5_9TREE|nr:uncharacterized protein I206_04803 [Kwoniella pini CBS 10737]OCF49116.1 hypothetical protein I206_04803 [Kwoniella pini CBS 10737]